MTHECVRLERTLEHNTALHMPPPGPGIMGDEPHQADDDQLCAAVATSDMESVDALLRVGAASPCAMLASALPSPSGHVFEARTPALHIAFTVASLTLCGGEPGRRPVGFQDSIQAAIIRRLIFQGVDWEAVDAAGRDIYLLLSEFKQPGTLDTSLSRLHSDERGVLVRFYDDLRQEFDLCGQRLHAAAERGRPGELQDAMKEITVNYQEVDGLTALHWAVVKGNLPGAEMLLAAGAKTTLRDNWGMSAIHTIVDMREDGLPGAADPLSCDTDRQHSLRYEPALAIEVRHALLELFVANGASLDVTDTKGRTALYYALFNRQVDTAVGLVSNGCSTKDLLDANGVKAWVDEPMRRACVEAMALRVEEGEPLNQGAPEPIGAMPMLRWRHRSVVRFTNPRSAALEPEPELEPAMILDQAAADAATAAAAAAASGVAVEEAAAEEAVLLTERSLALEHEMEEKTLTMRMLSDEGLDVSSLQSEIDTLRQERDLIQRERDTLRVQQSRRQLTGRPAEFEWKASTSSSRWNHSSSEEGSGSDGSDGSDIDMSDFITPLTTSWEELEEEQQAAASELQWAEQSWINDNTRIISRAWAELSVEERQACEALEIEEDDWDDMELAETESEPAAAEVAAVVTAQGEREERARRERARQRNEVLSDEHLLAWRDVLIDEVAELLAISRGVAAKLLVAHQYNDEKIRSHVAPAWFSGEQDAILDAIGEGAAVPITAAVYGLDGLVECGVCMDELPPMRVTTNRCGHSFCNDCVSAYMLLVLTLFSPYRPDDGREMR
jgi:hypothetical protein